MNPLTKESFTKTTSLGINCIIEKDAHELFWVHPDDVSKFDWMIKVSDALDSVNLGLIINDENYYWIPIRNGQHRIRRDM